MKKIIISFILSVTLLWTTYWEDEWASSSKPKASTTVIVSEKVPGANCTLLSEQWPLKPWEADNYQCEIWRGFSAVTSIMWAIIKYFTFLAWLFWVLFIVVNGIMYSAGGMDQSVKDEAKKRIIGTLVGLILLFMSGLILNILAPWIYK